MNTTNTIYKIVNIIIIGILFILISTSYIYATTTWSGGSSSYLYCFKIDSPAEGAVLSSNSLTVSGIGDAYVYWVNNYTVNITKPTISVSVRHVSTGNTQSNSAVTSLYSFTFTLPYEGQYVISVSESGGDGTNGSGTRTIWYDCSNPTAPTVTTSQPVCLYPVINWSGASDTSGISGYNVYRDGALITPTPITATQYTDNAAPEGYHSYTVKAIDGAGKLSASSNSVTVLMDRTAPVPPTGLTCPNPSFTDPLLRWNASTAPDISYYKIYRDSTHFGTTTGISFIAGCADGSYTFQVSAVDGIGNEGTKSNLITVIVDKFAPVMSAITAPVYTKVPPLITWNPAFDLNGVKEYKIYRDNVLIGTQIALSITDASVTEGFHTYEVSAVDTQNLEGNRSAKTVTYDITSPEAPAGIYSPRSCAGVARITWEAANDNLSGINKYKLYKDGLFLVETANTFFSDSGITAGKHTYAVRAVDRAANEGLSTSPITVDHDRTPPLVTIESPAGGEKLNAGDIIDITWTATDEWGVNLASVMLRYSTNGGLNWNFLTRPGNTTTYAWKLPNVGSSKFAVSVDASDMNGNRVTSVSRTFEVQKTAVYSAKMPIVYASVTGDNVNGLGSATSPFRTIQKAMDNVDVNGTVYLFPGTYNESNIIWSKTNNVTLKPVSDMVVIDGMNSGRIFNVEVPVTLKIENISIINAYMEGDGAGMFLAEGSNLTLNKVDFSSCQATNRGGAIFAKLSNVTAVNSIFSGNSAGLVGGASYAGNWNAQNCTFIGNSSVLNGGLWSSSNCIFWDNMALFPFVDKPNLSYCDIQGWTSGGTGNISADPKLDANGRLTVGSPCIDKGSGTIAEDIDGRARPQGNAIDMGASEFAPNRPRIVTNTIMVNGVAANNMYEPDRQPELQAEIIDEYSTIGMPSIEVQIGNFKYFASPEVLANGNLKITCKPDSELGNSKTYAIAITVTNMYGLTDKYSTSTLGVTNVLSVVGKPKAVPNPCRPKHNEPTKIVYDMTLDSPVKLCIYDITGRLLWQRYCPAGTSGGSRHNEVDWDGKTDFGENAANGVYIYVIASDGKALAKGQAVVMD